MPVFAYKDWLADQGWDAEGLEEELEACYSLWGNQSILESSFLDHEDSEYSTHMLIWYVYPKSHISALNYGTWDYLGGSACGFSIYHHATINDYS